MRRTTTREAQPATHGPVVKHSTAIVVATSAAHRALGDLVTDLELHPVFVLPSADLPKHEGDVSLCVIDLHGHTEAVRAISLARRAYPGVVVIGVADPARPTASADAIRAGAFDVLPSPPQSTDLEALLANAAERRAIAEASRPTSHATTTPSAAAASHAAPGQAATVLGLVGQSPAMRAIADQVAKASTGRTSVLVCGEAGTGRTVIARAIHNSGRGEGAPFIYIDCAAVTPDALELDLFGTLTKRSPSAVERRSLERIHRNCRIVDAAGGTLFLAHVTEMPERVQARLARVLRDREVSVEGEPHPLSLDIRPIAAADPGIDAAIDDGRMRKDLCDRLSGIRIDVPPLRLRRDDIPLLAAHALQDICRRAGRPLKTLTRPALTLLSALPWRGNIPELDALLERLCGLVPGGLIRLEDVLAHTQIDTAGSAATSHDVTLRHARARFEREYIASVLQQHHGRVAESARVLGIQRTNLYRKMRRLNVMRRSRRGDAGEVE